MPYGDELIIAQRLANQREKLHTIDNKVYINGIEYTFARREFEYGFSMVVPELFEEMPKEIIDRKFPSKNSPKIVITSTDNLVSLAFDTYDMDAESIERRVTGMRAYIKRISPSNVFFTEGIYELNNGMTVGHFDYRYPVIDGDVYNMTFITDLPDAKLIGWFICPLEMQSLWEPLARQMIKTIDVIGKQV